MDKIYKKQQVQPLSRDDIKRVKAYLINRPEYCKGLNAKYYTLFCFGINSGLRIDDILHLRISDVMKDEKIVDEINLKEVKTQRIKTAYLNQNIKDLLFDFIANQKNWKHTDYLFHTYNDSSKSLSRQTVYSMMKEIEKELDLGYPIGTHSLRKTFARAIFDANQDDPLVLFNIKKMLGHRDIDTTLKYLGIKYKNSYKVDI